MSETDANRDERDEDTEDDEEFTLLGHNPVLGPSDPEADEHGDNLTRVDQDELGD